MTLPFTALLASLLAVVPTTPFTSGAWTTYLKASRVSDLLARGDTVWCSTRDAGLLRYSRAEQRFHGIARSPNGLASNELSVMTYDRSGSLWIGTYGAGASRMSADGSSWTLLNAFDGLPSDTVNCLTAEGDTLWIGTPRGLAFWNGTVVAGSLPIFGQPSPFASDNITGVVTRPESLWVATTAGIYTTARSGPPNDWTEVNAGLYANIVIQSMVTNDTLLFCLGSQRVWKYTDGFWVILDGLGDVQRLACHDGVVIATSTTGIFRVHNGGGVVICNDAFSSGVADENAYSAALDRDGRYLAMDARGLLEQPPSLTLNGWPLSKPDGPPSNDIRNLGLDGDKVWLACEVGGVGMLRGSTWRIWPSTPSPCAGPGCDTTFYNPIFTKALLVDKLGHKWFGCWEFSMEQFDDKTNPGGPPQVTHHIITGDVLGPDIHTRMWASAADDSGGRWFGGDTNNFGVVPAGGIDYYDKTGAWVANLRSSNSGMRGDKVHGLTVDKGNRVWFGLTGQGIGRFAIPRPWTTPTIEYVTGSDRLDVQGLVARGDTLWALTTHELQRYRTSSLGLPVATYTIPEATPLFAVNPLAVGPDGSPWVGTEAGVRVFRSGGRSEDFNTRNSPIAGDQVYAIRVDPVTGVVWISTSTGMNRYDPGYRAPAPPQLPSLNVSVYPNPVLMNRGGVQLRLTGNATAYRGSILDLNGRRVRRFETSGNQRVIWDGHDDEGKRVKPGIYFVFVEAGGRSATVRVAVLR